MQGLLFDIQKSSFVDGPGLRTTVFFKGCHLHCKWCHNPESQSARPEMLFYADKCVGCGACERVCPHHLKACDYCGTCETYCPKDARKVCGKRYTVDEVFAEVVKDKAFYDASGGGVTFSGGECLLQIDFLTALAKKCRENGIQTAVDTAGDVPWASFEKVLPYTDLFLYDLKCFDEKKHIEGTGVSNRRLLDNLRRLSDETDVPIIVRIPVVPGFNDGEEELSRMADFLKTVRHDGVECLPYHAMGEHKYAALGRDFERFPVPDKERMEEIRRLFA